MGGLCCVFWGGQFGKVGGVIKIRGGRLGTDPWKYVGSNVHPPLRFIRRGIGIRGGQEFHMKIDVASIKHIHLRLK